MEAKHESKLLETGWGQPARGQCNLVCRQVPHDFPDALNILGEFGIVCLVALQNLLCSSVSADIGLISDKGQHTISSCIDGVWVVNKRRQATADESFFQALGAFIEQ